MLAGGAAVLERPNQLVVNVACAAGEVWNGFARSVSCTTSEGKIGILPGHSPLLATLAKGIVEIHQKDHKILIDAVDGFVSVADDIVTIIAADAILLGQCQPGEDDPQ